MLKTKKTKAKKASRPLFKKVLRLTATTSRLGHLAEASPRVGADDLEAMLMAPLPKDATSRLEARIPAHVYEAMERAATLRGLTMTAYVTAIMGEDARRTIEQTEIIRLSRADQIAFASALANPPEPSARWRASKRRHAELIGK